MGSSAAAAAADVPVSDTRGTGAVMPWALSVPLANFDSVALDLKTQINTIARDSGYEGSNKTHRQASVAMIAGDLMRATETAAFAFKVNARGLAKDLEVFESGDYVLTQPVESSRLPLPVVAPPSSLTDEEPEYADGNPYMGAIEGADEMFRHIFEHKDEGFRIHNYMKGDVDSIAKRRYGGGSRSAKLKGPVINAFMETFDEVRVSNDILDDRVNKLVLLLASAMTRNKIKEDATGTEFSDIRLAIVSIIALLRSTSAWSGNPLPFIKMMRVVAKDGIDELNDTFAHYGLTGI